MFCGACLIMYTLFVSPGETLTGFVLAGFDFVFAVTICPNARECRRTSTKKVMVFFIDLWKSVAKVKVFR
jgi:hypothetical protein